MYIGGWPPVLFVNPGDSNTTADDARSGLRLPTPSGAKGSATLDLPPAEDVYNGTPRTLNLPASQSASFFDDLSGAVENGIQHVQGQASGLGVLLAGMVAGD